MSVRRWLGDSRVSHAEARSWPTGRYVPLCGATCDESYGWRLSSRRANCQRCRRVRDAAKRDADAATLENLSGVERVNEEERQFFADLEQRRRQSQDREYQAALGIYSIAKQNYFIDQRRTIEAEKQAKIEADKNKATEESLRRQQDIVNAINGIKQSSIDRTAGLVTSIENLNQIAARIEQGVRGLR